MNRLIQISRPADLLLLLSLMLAFSTLPARAATAPFSFTFDTTQGTMHFDCPSEWAPLGEQRLRELVTDGFFTNTAFFRVITGFVAQFGISGDPAVSAQWQNANLADDPVVASNVAGTLTFATAGPNTRTTQFFINLGDNSRLDSMGFSPVCKLSQAGDLAVAQKLYAGYGEAKSDGGQGPDQDTIASQGDAYLKTDFPKLDYIQSATFNLR